MKRITILGATGSIGASTADVVLRHADQFAVHALVGHRNHGRMLELAHALKPAWVVMTDAQAASALKDKLPTGTRLGCDMDAAIATATDASVDIVLAAMVGSVGLPAALAAVRAGKRVALANKECLVTAGRLFMQEAAESGADVVPVDSEHAAVHQCLVGHDKGSIRRIILTASGGPFRDRDVSTMRDITPEQAIAHPNWDMGAKISVDSATMMNKALELIEARWLFGVAPDKLSAVIHPQSVVHGMVEYTDGSVVAQLAEPDMRGPIAYALQMAPRLASGIPFLDLAAHGRLDFQAVDEARFPAMRLVKAVLAGADSLAIAFNAANEVANQAFRDRRIGFMDIVSLVEQVMQGCEDVSVQTLDEVWSRDRESRVKAESIIQKFGG
ncbi:MAG: 1-deoxy-D-xylulose-5-phosphate reductoisomerase [Zetaproteobacteria bacterium CG12_big_fil_rev_8_21_14_0_65_55_1124]|nr:MAG: 1-deoxy-D-xylulose-5-phosphate reductoisomerase [Zetaproteobacteria bacterium CG08_land_8_20_14_0_20_55_17]PIW42555.1 MAG: 1-deoxy-D-xylulose-5-phosphate reductoisomerase [Zetaproteobacteria bacterium CG12_big_fil_rev_8_21_14_0_65_55_1124]PIY51294.1 MAG: 1-deoxy-D-xylulose-5-phosphate reductoisomerase [Zetaproteobacteria bacterium CG_4_10_14_0_8_um_filter_55_43]PIZ36649.1 MAG: 1-deoxy-D-xylulose-5-phosphate reductoisomerase [Zetaproteobacteria bacterium CG_4_10_14_0_2_um_filter_55_20]PJ